jgi:predicted metalloprotease
MRWKTGRRSSNVEDRRGQGGGLGGFRFPMPRMPRAGLPGGPRVGLPGGMRVGMPRSARGGGIGCLGILLLIVLFMVLFNLGPFAPPGTEVSSVPSSTSLGPAGSAPQDELADFVSVVLADTEDTWHALLPAAGVAYQEPTLVLFSGYTQTACGLGQSATGPFYCPLDHKLYIDLGFYDELRTRFGAPGDFAQAYVIAHEVGHHVQTLLGISQEVDAARRRSSQVQANELSVRLELQADCLSGIWAHHAQRERQILEEGDIEEGLAAAAAIGDDRIQRQTQGNVVPDSFTHGSSQQRVRWFRRGFETGDLGTCDTFSATDL